MTGHYTSLSATGPGDTLWYAEDGTWTTNQEARKVFTCVNHATQTPIQGLPSGYRPTVVFVNVTIVYPPNWNLPTC